MSSTPAGWYPSKKNPGMARYWDGAAWTDQYRPLPEDEEAPPTNYSQVAPVQPSPAYQQPQQASPWSPENIVESVKKAALDKENQAKGAQVAGGALIADGIVGFGEKRPSIFGALGTIGFGIFWIIFTSFLLGPMTAGNEVKAGETKISAQVTEIQWNSSTSSSSRSKTQGCSPVASFAVDGKTYTARSSGYTSPCPWDKGDKVDVIYNPNQIEGSARVDDSKSVAMFTTLFPLAGYLVIIGGIWTFIKRAGSIGAGIYLLRHGRKKYEALQAEKNRKE